jgi:2-keto-3-deoxy-L-rhamnonate aldolase RhmA
LDGLTTLNTAEGGSKNWLKSTRTDAWNNLMRTTLRTKILRQDLLIGTIITLPSAEISEILSLAGLDWLFVDLEHGALSVRDAQRILQAATPKTPCVIRVPSNDETWIKKCLDIGAEGVLVPQIRTPSDAERAVRFCKYPPEGSRSVGIARSHGYGTIFQEYIESANSDIAVILQIEHMDAVNNIEKICNVSGIDALFIGPYDLSASMGKMGLTNDPDVIKAISRITQCARRANIPLGIFGINEEAVKPYMESGCTLIAVGIDTVLLGETAAKIIRLLKHSGKAKAFKNSSSAQPAS